ncbi:uncharacterized protein LOC141600703 [Silene latifolia]|uniref:uncharacterized protein LOC141600703 n=1 Tax=Silene latifolia TaxID=37657 RepID=UPI003D785D96
MTNNNSNTSTQPSIPIFKGEKYHLWSLKMKTMFKSQDLWDLIEAGYTEPDPTPAIPDAQLKENRKKDAKALFYIQSALEDEFFPRIIGAQSAHEAWETLKQEYLGDQRVLKVRLQTLRRDFAELTMGDKESVQTYLSRVTDIVGQMRSYGETISNEDIVSKVLRSMNDDWNLVVPAIEESKDLSTYTFDALMGSLLAHESRMKKYCAKAEEKAFKAQGESSNKGRTENYGNWGRGRGSFRGGRGRGRDNGRGRGHSGGRGKGLTNDSYAQKSQIQCYCCKKYGHKEVDCWFKAKNEQSQANF